MLNEMQREGLLEIRDVEYYGLLKKEYIARAPETAGALNDSELALLDEVIEFVCEHNSAKTISDYSHQLPWEMADFGEEIPYRSAYLLIPSPVSPEAFDATEQGMKQLEASGSDRNSVVFGDFGAFRSRLKQANGTA